MTGPGAAGYALSSDASGHDRLRLLDEVFGEATRDLLRDAGEGTRLVELGCGTGSVARWMAARVGQAGRVTGVDQSAAHLEEARRMAAGMDNIEFRRASAAATGLARASFTHAYCRFLLSHVPKPIEVVREMRDLVQPGGWVVCEEVDLEASFCEPPSAAHDRMKELVFAADRKLGMDHRIGRKLHHLFAESGIGEFELRCHQPLYLRGEGKRFLWATYREAAPAFEEAGLASRGEIEGLIAEMARVNEDEGVLVAMGRVHQARGRVWSSMGRKSPIQT